MSENKFTPGPWVVPDEKPTSIVANGSEIICNIRQANAHLVASAPDMYEALTRPDHREHDSNGNIVLRINEERYNAIISKAEGRA